MDVEHFQFPLALAKSMDVADMESVAWDFFHVTWKPACKPFMLLVTADGNFLIDLHFHFWHCGPLHFPGHMVTTDPDTELLFRCEFVMDKPPDAADQPPIPRLLVADMLHMFQEFPVRYAAMERLFQGRNKLLPQQKAEQRLKLRLKPHVPSRQITKLVTADFGGIVGGLPHEWLGLLFVPRDRTVKYWSWAKDTDTIGKLLDAIRLS